MVMNPRTHPRGAPPDFSLPSPNPNPMRMTDALWWMVQMCELLEPASQNGGTYANKPGSHNIGDNLPDYGEGDSRTDHSIRHAWNRTGSWWRSKTAGRDWTFPDAQRGDYSTINKYTRRIINAMKDPNDLRPDHALFYVLGNTDGDVQTEGYNELKNGAESSGDDSHAWHIHESWFRDSVGKFGAMWAVLTIYMGWSYADYLKSVQPKENAMPLTSADADVVWAKQTTIPGTTDVRTVLDLLRYLHSASRIGEIVDALIGDEAIQGDVTALKAEVAALRTDVGTALGRLETISDRLNALMSEPFDYPPNGNPEEHPFVMAFRYVEANPTPPASA